MIFKWIFNVLLLIWVYHTFIRPILVRHFSQQGNPPVPPPPPPPHPKNEEGEYIDYEEVK